MARPPPPLDKPSGKRRKALRAADAVDAVDAGDGRGAGAAARVPDSEAASEGGGSEGGEEAEEEPSPADWVIPRDNHRWALFEVLRDHPEGVGEEELLSLTRGRCTRLGIKECGDETFASALFDIGKGGRPWAEKAGSVSRVLYKLSAAARDRRVGGAAADRGQAIGAAGGSVAAAAGRCGEASGGGPSKLEVRLAKSAASTQRLAEAVAAKKVVKGMKERADQFNAHVAGLREGELDGVSPLGWPKVIKAMGVAAKEAFDARVKVASELYRNIMLDVASSQLLAKAKSDIEKRMVKEHAYVLRMKY